MTPTLRRIVRGTALTGGGVVVVLAVLYAFFGLRIEYRGGGTPYLTFGDDLDARAAAIAQHREQQRAAALEAAAAAPVAATAGAPATGAAVESAPVVDESPAAPYWTDFRGPVRDGHYRERAISTKWPAAGLEPIWKQPVGGGYASFVVARGRAFTIEQRGPQEVAAAYDVMTGRELWTNAWPALFREALGGDGPRATPAWADGMVYALGATGELRALDEANGRPLWRTNILADAGAANLDWGMAASPLVVGNTVVVLPGGSGGRSIVAYDRRTGARAWSALDDKQAYSSPMIATLAGVRQLVVLTASRLVGLTPDRGDVLWDIRGGRISTSTRRSRSSSAATACSSQPVTAQGQRSSKSRPKADASPSVRCGATTG